jgi:hypothetical protein
MNMKNKIILRFKVLLIIFGLCSRLVYAQSEINKFQLDLLLGETVLKNNPALTLGFGLDHYINRFVISGQFLVTSRAALSAHEAKNYYNLDILAGLNKDKNRFGFSLSTGIGLAFRNEGVESIYYQYEKSYLTVGIPIRGKINYKFGKHLALGFIGYSNFNFKQNIFGLSINLGYRF